MSAGWQVYSPVGRTRTIPTATDDIARTRIAYFSCSNLVYRSCVSAGSGLNRLLRCCAPWPLWNGHSGM